MLWRWLGSVLPALYWLGSVLAAQEVTPGWISSLRSQVQLCDKHRNCTHEFVDQCTPAQVIYEKGIFKQYLGETPVLALDTNYNTGRIGNFLGSYFDSVACANQTMHHFINFNNQFDENEDLFWTAFPSVIFHPNVSKLSYQENLKMVKNVCPCDRYCFGPNHPWAAPASLTFMRGIIQKALSLDMSVRNNEGKTKEEHGLILSSHDYVSFLHSHNKSLNTRENLHELTHVYLPLFPDVAVHYRCSDNLFGGMGLLSFKFIKNMIPADAKYIYIFHEFTDYIAAGTDMQLKSTGRQIIDALFHYIKDAFPNAVVVIKVGGRVLTIFSQFARAKKVLICSASSFCLFPAIAREGVTYMPAGTYIACGGTNPDGCIRFHNGFHWMQSNTHFNNFTANNTIEQIIQTLTN